MGFKIALIGSHGVGKTTLCLGLAARLKARDIALDLVHEVARRCPLPINQETSVASESWILHTQIAEELNRAGWRTAFGSPFTSQHVGYICRRDGCGRKGPRALEDSD